MTSANSIDSSAPLDLTEDELTTLYKILELEAGVNAPCILEDSEAHEAHEQFILNALAKVCRALNELEARGENSHAAQAQPVQTI